MSLTLVPQTEPVLRKIARPVSDFSSKRLRAIVEEMEDVRINAGGIGLAAPQVGVSERIIIVEVPDDQMVGLPGTVAVPPTLLINPELVWESEDHIKLPEGCLSLPGLMGNVSRPESVRVAAQDIDGNAFTMHAGGWLARVLQHELDHLDGILFVDRIEEPSELWRVERVDIYDPVWDCNPAVVELREKRRAPRPAEPRLV